MRNVIFALVSLLFALGGVVVRKTYFRLPVRELKRRAERHDATARALYRAVAYGNSLRGLLWLYIGLTSAAGVILLAREIPVWASLLIIGPILWVTFSLLPASRTSSFGTWLTLLVTPFIARLLDYLHPVLSRGARIVEHRKAPPHTKLYEREDLLRLVDQQQHQEDSRISQEELEIAKRALQFDDYRVADIMTPRKKVKTVLASDTIGPVLINELHESGQEQVLVRESAKGPFVGNIKFSQLGLESKGQVRSIMQPTVYYVHENDTLTEALHAFFVTNHPVFVVVNSAEEYVGVIAIEDIVRQLVGHLPGEDFDQYANSEAVAGRHPKIRKSKEAEFTIDNLDETPVKTKK